MLTRACSEHSCKLQMSTVYPDGDPLAGKSLAEVDSACIEARLRTLEER